MRWLLCSNRDAAADGFFVALAAAFLVAFVLIPVGFVIFWGGDGGSEADMRRLAFIHSSAPIAWAYGLIALLPAALLIRLGIGGLLMSLGLGLLGGGVVGVIFAGDVTPFDWSFLLFSIRAGLFYAAVSWLTLFLLRPRLFIFR